ncbi:MAG: hypothetical protein HQK65_19770, partial [Desulfamplus sp.]|nr:hypothetical protein [Desulfamplus sp.]
QGEGLNFEKAKLTREQRSGSQHEAQNLILSNPHADTFLNLKNRYPTDIRLVWEKLREGKPDGYQLFNEAAVNVVNGQWSAKKAADFVQKGLSQWFEPATRCKKE